MAKTEYLFLQGKGSWIKADRPDAEYNKWSMVLHPNQESLEKIRDLQAEGVKNVLKKDDDGYYLTISRKTSITSRGKIIPLERPKVVDKNGAPLDGVAIGNGSDVTVKCEVYSHSTPGGGKAKAIRWYALKVDNLIPFEPKRDFDAATQEQVSGLAEQPEQLF